ncbi:peptide N-acetyl-beta-D-glucosaminyl asparaginase amidase A-domain-containing protein [Mycena rebaudengoi]|nr:peptide N-acetyl-beta-D-glucosaminyl asparaginase amidase A-domain-containing protein [Mycena rebaudengoi]
MLPTLWFLYGLFFAVVSPQGSAVLVNFQVAQPPPVPQDARQCTIQILQRDFAFSFGLAEVVQYAPPTDCGPPGSWAAVSLNFTVTSNGTQFDRLAIFTFQNVEIWRSSTPEPTAAGIIWTHLKDVTRYTPLFAKPGTFILQLDNLIQTGLNGVYSTTLHATFYASSPRHPPAKKANSIIPLSTLSNATGNDASVPPGFSVTFMLTISNCDRLVLLDQRDSSTERRRSLCRSTRFVFLGVHKFNVLSFTHQGIVQKNSGISMRRMTLLGSYRLELRMDKVLSARSDSWSMGKWRAPYSHIPSFSPEA